MGRERGCMADSLGGGSNNDFPLAGRIVFDAKMQRGQRARRDGASVSPIFEYRMSRKRNRADRMFVVLEQVTAQITTISA